MIDFNNFSLVYVIDKYLLFLAGFALMLGLAKVVQLMRIERALLNYAEMDYRRLGREIGKGLGVLKMIATTAPMVGLGGTVLSVMDALKSISTLETASNFMAIAQPIGAALGSTFLGILAATPALMALSFLSVKISVIQDLMQSNSESKGA